MEIIKVLVISLLVITAIMDIKWKRINLLILIPFLIAGLWCNLFYQVTSLQSMIGGILVGVVLLVISLLTRGKIGSGDGVLLMCTGVLLGFYDNLLLLLSATFLSAIIGAIILLVKGVNKNYEIPFVPFLLVAFVGGIML